ncbi:TauD/TfdA family dioxygenase [Streptomyces stelliscabiei]|uniref:Alpha-ketoglutarate-dependent taurine dioxygenase n=2 Tax=Streptomyces stelliscabiei TaxID=146820 RepID=A0A8I0PGB6_9ACTN|nr:TauD/TfdA family dioxygenase [Streptomyces stelliscabiei]KND46182.1 SyrP [Streptomyces stelliscabiei]MBE1601053.1 alpha-ketoglutarate-dependent taurine dioxygenase [Streptomyces stelliscabiei]MDX2518432.1 TauD/TfdA family dioxygenase [Streptomyces stelliscabiei]
MGFLSRRAAGRRRKDPATAPSSATALPLPLPLPDIVLSTDSPPLLTVSPAEPAARWAAGRRDSLRAAVAEHGSVLVRGLGLRDAVEVGAVFRGLTDTLMTEREAFAPRRTYARGVYSSTAWPPNQPMCMHHESSYGVQVPGLLLLACLEAAERGGATGIADSAAVLAALPAELTERFEREGWLLTRSYHDEIGASVAEAFGTDDRTVVEAYCRAHSIDFDWGPDGTLRTRQRRPAVLRHPVNGRRCWFNQIAFLSEWTMDAEVREYLVDLYGADGLPFNTRYGDGEPIGADVVETLNEVYEAHTVRRPWRPGDLLLVDNLRCAHSREPYQGPREVLVGLADPVRPADFRPAGFPTKESSV